jgi:hypothetical protein
VLISIFALATIARLGRLRSVGRERDSDRDRARKIHLHLHLRSKRAGLSPSKRTGLAKVYVFKNRDRNPEMKVRAEIPNELNLVRGRYLGDGDAECTDNQFREVSYPKV